MSRDPVEPLEASSRSLRLATLLAERLCHDLGGAVGTVAGALELADEPGAEGQEALALAREASAALLSRFRLLRAAWGGAGAAHSPAALRALTSSLPNRRVRADLDGLTAQSEIAEPFARLLVNLVLLGMECLPEGGEVALEGDASGEVIVSLSGQRAAWTVGLGKLLADRETAWDAIDAAQADGGRTLQAPLVALLAREAGVTLTMLVGVEASNTPPLLLRCGRER